MTSRDEDGCKNTSVLQTNANRFSCQLLNDKESLRELYETKKMSTVKIAELLDVANSTVYQALKYHRIPVRSKSTSSKLRYGFQITSKDLRNLYQEKKMSSIDIAKLYGCSKRTILRRLREYGIERRSNSESAKIQFENQAKRKKFEEGMKSRTFNHVKNISYPLNSLAEEFITGSLLGDGNLTRVKLSSKQNSSYKLGSKHKEYVESVAELLAESGYCSSIHTYSKRPNRILHSLTTNRSLELRNLRIKWYPDGIKQVPRDITLTPTVCYAWYIEDGSLQKYNGRAQRIRLSTSDFSYEENVFLKKKLVRVLGCKGIKVLEIKSKGLYYLNLSKVPSLRFMEYIEKSMYKAPVCFDYKFTD